MDTTDGVGAKLPAQEQREPAGWRPGSELTPLEVEMAACAAAGELADCGGGPFNFAAMQEWAPERTVRAAVLRHLLIGKDWPTDARGVRLRGIRISGPLDLEAAALHCPLYLDSCFLDAKLVCLDQASATGLTITGCHYQTWRAGVGLAAVFVVFLALSVLGQHRHVIAPVGVIRGLHLMPSATQCTSDYPCFYPRRVHRRHGHPAHQRAPGRVLGPRRARGMGLDMGGHLLGSNRTRLGPGNPARRRLHRTRPPGIRTLSRRQQMAHEISREPEPVI